MTSERVYSRELNRLLDAGVEYREACALARDVAEEYWNRRVEEGRDMARERAMERGR